jgi:hypothetical protein
MNKETVEQAALKWFKDKAFPNEWMGDRGEKDWYMDDIFKAGAEWQKEQSATDAIEFATWVIQNFWSFSEKDKSWYNRTEVAPGKEYKNKTSQQLYELWEKSKSNADN